MSSRSTSPHPARSAAVALLALASLGAGCAARGAQTAPDVVPDFDVERYLGLWYEIASIPIAPTRGCIGSTAEYALRDDGDISVLNRCWDESFTGRRREATARAFIPDPAVPAKLKVEFFWPFRAEYWVVELDTGYTTAVVSNSSRSTMWILHRAPCMPQATFDGLAESLAARGFSLAELQSTPQRDADGVECRVTL